MDTTQTQLDELIKAERRAYFKVWRAANPDKVKRHNENYWRNRAEKRLKEDRREGDKHE